MINSNMWRAALSIAVSAVFFLSCANGSQPVEEATSDVEQAHVENPLGFSPD